MLAQENVACSACARGLCRKRRNAQFNRITGCTNFAGRLQTNLARRDVYKLRGGVGINDISSGRLDPNRTCAGGHLTQSDIAVGIDQLVPVVTAVGVEPTRRIHGDRAVGSNRLKRLAAPGNRHRSVAQRDVVLSEDGQVALTHRDRRIDDHITRCASAAIDCLQE